MKPLKDKKEFIRTKKKSWEKPAIREVKSLLVTKGGQWGDPDGSTQGTHIS